MDTIKVTTTDQETGEELIIAVGEMGNTCISAEGKYFFSPEVVNTELLSKNPDKSVKDAIGFGDYYDIISPLSRDVIKTQVIFIYNETTEDWDAIKGMYGVLSMGIEGVTVDVFDASGEELTDDDLEVELGVDL